MLLLVDLFQQEADLRINNNTVDGKNKITNF